MVKNIILVPFLVIGILFMKLITIIFLVFVSLLKILSVIPELLIVRGRMRNELSGPFQTFFRALMHGSIALMRAEGALQCRLYRILPFRSLAAKK